MSRKAGSQKPEARSRNGAATVAVVAGIMGFAAALSAQTEALTQGAYRLEIKLEKQEADQWRGVDPRLVLQADDRVRFRARANFAGYLYVLNHATSGAYTLLFPRQETGRANRIEAGREYTVPADDGAFRIAGPPGHEVVYWLLSPVEFTAGLPSSAPKGPPPKLIPRCDETILRARGDCIDTSAGPKPVRKTERLPEPLAAVPGATGRELLFVRQKDTAVVSSPGGLEGPVIFEFRLAHR